MASLALQHGCPAETILHALVRHGKAGGPLGALLLAVAVGQTNVVGDFLCVWHNVTILG